MRLRRLLSIILLSASLGLSPISASSCDIYHGEASIENGTMPYLSAGQGTPVLLIHGLFAQKEQWNDLICNLANAGYRALAPDLPGYGQSIGYNLDVYPLEVQTRLLHSFILQIGREPHHIAGNSMGGAIAAIYAQTYPNSVYSLAFIGGTLGIGPWGKTVQKNIFAGNNPFIPLTPEALNAELAMLLVHPPMLEPTLQSSILAPYQQNTNHYVQIWNIVNLYDRILADGAASKVRTLILWGAQDLVFAATGSQPLAKKFPHHHLRILPEAGHLAMIDAPGDVGRTYLNFLGRQANQ